MNHDHLLAALLADELHGVYGVWRRFSPEAWKALEKKKLRQVFIQPVITHFSLYVNGVFFDITSKDARQTVRYLLSVAQGKKTILNFRERPAQEDDPAYYCFHHAGCTDMPLWMISEIMRRLSRSWTNYSYTHKNCQQFFANAASYLFQSTVLPRHATPKACTIAELKVLEAEYLALLRDEYARKTAFKSRRLAFAPSAWIASVLKLQKELHMAIAASPLGPGTNMNTLSRSFLGLKNIEVIHRICVTWVTAECEAHATTIPGLNDRNENTPCGDKLSNIRVHIKIHQIKSRIYPPLHESLLSFRINRDFDNVHIEGLENHNQGCFNAFVSDHPLRIILRGSEDAASLPEAIPIRFGRRIYNSSPALSPWIISETELIESVRQVYEKEDLSIQLCDIAQE